MHVKRLRGKRIKYRVKKNLKKKKELYRINRKLLTHLLTWTHPNSQGDRVAGPRPTTGRNERHLATGYQFLGLNRAWATATRNPKTSVVERPLGMILKSSATYLKSTEAEKQSSLNSYFSIQFMADATIRSKPQAVQREVRVSLDKSWAHTAMMRR